MFRKIIEKISDVFFELLFIGITALVTSFIGLSYSRIYILLSTIIMLLLYIVIVVLKQKYKRPFRKRFTNEKQALPEIKKLIKATNKEMNILSKVGTTIFDLFDEYVELLQNESVLVKIILVDPTYEKLIELIDKMFADKEEAAPRHKKWLKMITDILERLDFYLEQGSIDKTDYSNLTALLGNAEKNGYKDLISASKLMWEIAQKKANEKAVSNNKHHILKNLQIYYCKNLPDIKAWISDGNKGAIGNYDAMNLGRDNPIDFYKPNDGDNPESSQFRNILDVWDYKISDSILQKGMGIEN